MRRLIKILVMTMLLATVLVLPLKGTVFAANGQSGNGNKGDECPYGVCDNENCEPKACSCNYSYEISGTSRTEKHGTEWSPNSDWKWSTEPVPERKVTE